MFDIPLTEVMVSPVISVNSRDPVALAEEKMRLNRIRHIPVVDDSQVLVGIVTYRIYCLSRIPKGLTRAGFLTGVR